MRITCLISNDVCDDFVNIRYNRVVVSLVKNNITSF